MSVRSAIGTEVRVLGTATAIIGGAGSTNFDFGTPNDLKLTPLLKSRDRVIVVFTAVSMAVTQAEINDIDTQLTALDALIATADANVGAPSFVTILAAMVTLHSTVGAINLSTAGSTDTVSFAVLDAPDSSGSIGATGAAVADGVLTGGVGSRSAVAGVKLQSGRPWLRLTLTSTGSSDTFTAVATVLALPGGL